MAAIDASGSEEPGLPGNADPFARSDPPLLAMTLRPNRSLTPAGVSWLMGLAAVGLILPLVAFAGSKVGWGMLPFLAGALLLLYCALRRSFIDGTLTEELRVWPDLITVERREPRGRVRRWHANPFWVRLRLVDEGRVEKYLTLQGNGREIELGAFLSPGEREVLHAELTRVLAGLR